MDLKNELDGIKKVSSAHGYNAALLDTINHINKNPDITIIDLVKWLGEQGEK